MIGGSLLAVFLAPTSGVGLGFGAVVKATELVVVMEGANAAAGAKVLGGSKPVKKLSTHLLK